MLPFKALNQCRRQSVVQIINEERGISEEGNSKAALQAEGKYSAVVNLEHDATDNKNVADEEAGMQNLKQVPNNSSETDQGVTDQVKCSSKGTDDKSLLMRELTSDLSQEAGIDNNLEITNIENKTDVSLSCGGNTLQVSEHVIEYESSLNSESTSTNWKTESIPIEVENNGSFDDSKGKFLSDDSLFFMRVTVVVSFLSVAAFGMALTTLFMISH
ncbi:uncharacterized protein LOC124368916 isoform X1 [Homalodisca vitripennis]|uniref:uncharacterized protein LOC124368916 isoform X1 n=1 Tax=Homalodisca vitripennis TaxID=197043 RepID=UPI001EEBD052|nr:uncharacterized protein LOC124368916 isoform X1 [Homalodisca vitripennis]